jgi:hypothetical protein
LTDKNKKMKYFILFFLIVTLFAACNQLVVQKPDNLIEEDKMVDIIYDLALLEAIKSSNPQSLVHRKINQATYIYKRHKIDSLQFDQSDRYYASDINNYSKMYERVGKRIENNKTAIDSIAQSKNKMLKKLPSKK